MNSSKQHVLGSLVAVKSDLYLISFYFVQNEIGTAKKEQLLETKTGKEYKQQIA